METITIEVLLESKQPIAHHMEVLGNTAMVMRRKVRQPSGEFTRVPYITGDTMRHGLREAGTYALLEAAGLLSASLSESALRLLFAGGMVTGSSGGVKLSDYYDLIEVCPHMALLGGCAQNRVIPGKLFCDDALLVCTETAHLVPQWVHDWLTARNSATTSGRQHVELVQRVRMDQTLDPAKRKLLTASAANEAEQRMLRSENASTHDDAKGKDEAKSSMLPRTYETLVAGSLFYWRVTCTCHTPLDRDMLYVMLSSFMASCRIGGKRATGNGMLAPVAAMNVDLPSWEDQKRSPETTALAGRAGDIFRAHVADRKDKIKSFLESVAA